MSEPKGPRSRRDASPSGVRRGSLPPKLYFRIGEVAGLVGVEPHVLRYWEREFRTIRPTKSAKGQRVYSRRDVDNLLRVRDLLYAEGFTIAGAKKRLLAGAEISAQPEAAPPSTDERAKSAADVLAQDGTDEEREPPSSRESARSAAASPSPRAREKLTALRAELEAFLQELGG